MSYAGKRTEREPSGGRECSEVEELERKGRSDPGGGETPILDLTGMLVVTFRG